MSSNLTCPVSGNSDLYGLGIRLGIYFQMLAVQLSNFSSDVLRTKDHLGQGTIILILATGIVLVRELASAGPKENKHIQPVEVFPILTLLFAQVRVCRVPYRGKQASQTTALIYIIEVAALIVLFVWFWWHGMDTLPRACADDKAFFFVKVSIWHWFRKLNKASSIIFAIAGSLAVVVYSTAVLSLAVYRIIVFVRRRRGQGNQENTSVFEDSDNNQPNTTFGTASVDVFVIVGAIVYVEMALKWNNISNVHTLASAGQFMPFFIALAQLVNVLYEMVKKGLSIVTAEDDASLSDLEDSDEHEMECDHVGGGWFKRAQDVSLPLTNLQ